MKIFMCLIVVALFCLTGCSSGIKVTQKPDTTQKIAILMFSDCKGDVDCEGSGKKVSDIYSQVLGFPLVMFESDAKGFDVLLFGNVVMYHEAIPMAAHANIIDVNLKLKRLADGKELISQKKQKMGSNVFSSAQGLTKDLAEDLKKAMN